MNSIIADMDNFWGKGEITQDAQLATLVLKSAKESKNTECRQSLPRNVQTDVSSKASVDQSFKLHFSLWRPSTLPEKGKN